MAGGMMVSAPSGKKYEGTVTIYVVLISIVAASGGLIFGYDIGISGGVTSMDKFLEKFFPKVYTRKHDTNSYCRFDDQVLQLFTSSLYLAGLVASFLASWTTQNLGRQPSMIIGGISFLVGGMLNAAAQDLAMLIIGRIFLGIGVGFANQAVPLYLSEMAPAQLRGALNICFQLATTIGILVANLINYGTSKPKVQHWGWRLSLGLAVIPAVILTLGSICVPETPNSLIERNKHDEGKATLRKIRGTTNVEEEYNDIVIASHQAQAIRDPFRNLLRRKHRPQLCVAILIPFFQQVTGINAIMFYAPVLFKTVGFGDDASMLSSCITGGVTCACTLVSLATVDRLGRKILFWEGGAQMLICQIAVGIILKYQLPVEIDAHLSKGYASAVVALICIYVAGFAWSWGPLGWLLPSEVFPLEIRSAAQSLTVAVNFLFTFIVGQAFLSILCNFEWGIFLFFGGWVLIMTMYVTFFLPETKSVPIEEMDQVWAKHWYWKRFVDSTAEPIHVVTRDLSFKRIKFKHGTNFLKDRLNDKVGSLSLLEPVEEVPSKSSEYFSSSLDLDVGKLGEMKHQATSGETNRSLDEKLFSENMNFRHWYAAPSRMKIVKSSDCLEGMVSPSTRECGGSSTPRLQPTLEPHKMKSAGWHHSRL